MRLLRRMSLRLSRRLAISQSPNPYRSAQKHSAKHQPWRRAVRPGLQRQETQKEQAGDFARYQWFDEFLQPVPGALCLCTAGAFRSRSHFLFSTNVVEISDLLRTRYLPEALRKLSRRAAGWSGGTRIGESLRQFNHTYGRKLLSRDTIFIILSDGWDTGEPQLLASQLRRTKARVQKVLWLNPLLGLKGYQPLTRGMAAALPYVDVFAPAHNLESLLALERHL